MSLDVVCQVEEWCLKFECHQSSTNPHWLIALQRIGSSPHEEVVARNVYPNHNFPPPMDDELVIITDGSEYDMVGCKDEFEDPNNISFINKRKLIVDLNIGMDQNLIYTCEPSLFSPVKLQPSILPQCFLQANSDSSPVNFGHPDFNPSANGVPDDGQNMISGIMSTYNNNTEGHIMTYDLKLQPQGEDNTKKFNDINTLFEEYVNHDYTNEPTTNDIMVMNNDNNNIWEMYGADPLDLSPSDYKEDMQGLLGTDTFPKMDDSIMFP
ncbi:hypothetical protein ACFE04_021806 [Oxalis oulophora]